MSAKLSRFFFLGLPFIVVLFLLVRCFSPSHDLAVYAVGFLFIATEAPAILLVYIAILIIITTVAGFVIHKVYEKTGHRKAVLLSIYAALLVIMIVFIVNCHPVQLIDYSR